MPDKVHLGGIDDNIHIGDDGNLRESHNEKKEYGEYLKEIIYDKKTFLALCQFLGCTQKQLNDAIRIIQLPQIESDVTLNRIQVPRTVKYGYHSFKIKKSDGVSYRTISAPCDQLKIIQSKILHALGPMVLGGGTAGGEPGTSPKKVAKRHLRHAKKYGYQADIKDAFPSVTIHRVYKNLQGALRQIFKFTFPYLLEDQRELFIGVLSNLVTSQGILPQGAPTSGRILNMCFAKADSQVIEYIHGSSTNTIIADGEYSRYIDDITVSFEGFRKDLHLLRLIEGTKSEVMDLIDGKKSNKFITLQSLDALKFNQDIEDLNRIFSGEFNYLDSDIRSQGLRDPLTRTAILKILNNRSYQLQKVENEYATFWESHKNLEILSDNLGAVMNAINRYSLENGEALVASEIRKIMAKNGRTTHPQKEESRNPKSSTVPVMLGIALGKDGRLGIPRKNFKKHLDFVKVVVNHPNSLPKRFRLDNGELDWIAIGQVLNGSYNFIKDVKGRVPEVYEKNYQHVYERYLKDLVPRKKNYYSYSDVKGANVQM